jgi:DNA recombination protein RmuC
METLLLITGLAAIAGVGYLIVSKKQDDAVEQQKLDQLNVQFNQSMQMMMNQLNAISTRVDDRLKEGNKSSERTHRNVGERLDNAAKVINQVTNKLSQLEESNKKIHDIGKDLSSLQEILRAPKLRGNLGELFLGDLLTQIFPKANFTLQHRFKSGAAVDAVIHLRDNLMVPVDAKFPLENFKRVIESDNEEEQKKMRKVFSNDVKKHVDAIASKYILPDEGTFDFALMYIPAENIYYEVIIRDQAEKSINQYALSKRVIPVSPNSFYIYLQALVMGLRGLQIEKGAKEILATLGRLKTDFERFGTDYELVGTHLGRAQSSYANSDKRFGKFKEKLEGIEGHATSQKQLAE